MQKVRVTGVQILTPSMRFFDYFFEFTNGFLHKFDIFINKPSRTRTKGSPIVSKLPDLTVHIKSQAKRDDCLPSLLGIGDN
jgi:hypothetical protein